MFLGYIDDSADRKHQKVEALAVVLLHDKKFQMLEHSLAITISNIIPEDRLDKFEEFKAWQLYGGYGVFDGVDQEERFRAIRYLLGTISQQRIPVVYGAVDLSAMARKSYASANPTDAAFRVCMPVISMVMAEQIKELGPEHGLEYALLIADNTDKSKRDQLRKTFRELRTQMRPPRWGTGLWFIHDEMYFGDSKDSVGIQLADLACYFIRKHLENEDPAAESFYNMFQAQIVYGKSNPTAARKQNMKSRDFDQARNNR